ncbi:hypothetical protein DFH07DRAFT_797189 [Mycena maculata]|uniref:Uncharacterized protein n=1 Tax=Mycena maculata TaxID=230809 RepID=A0AAD7NW41_9AGAR|nr:hypothetical protein DFH07DRAFT_797189 [Mycena maculata]
MLFVRGSSPVLLRLAPHPTQLNPPPNLRTHAHYPSSRSGRTSSKASTRLHLTTTPRKSVGYCQRGRPSGRALRCSTGLPMLPTNGTVYIKDFQKNVFDLAFASSADQAPVQSLSQNGIISQGWTITPNLNGTLFSVYNPSAHTGSTTLRTYLSFTLSNTTSNPTCAQLCGRPSVQTLWNITPSANKLGYNIIDPNSKLAVTSWVASNSSSVTHTAPLTLQNFDSADSTQIFTFTSYPQ